MRPHPLADALASSGAVAVPVHSFASLLGPDAGATPPENDQPVPDFASDLNLDQVISAIVADREEGSLIAQLLLQRSADAAVIEYRHEVFRDLEDPALFGAATRFSEQMREVRAHLSQLPKMSSGLQRQGWFLDAAAIYCDAVRSLAADLAGSRVTSRGLSSFRDFIAAYVRSAGFVRLDSETSACRAGLANIMYQVRISGPHVEVSRYEGEPDYSAEIVKTFERFQQGAAKDYRVQYRGWPGMNHVAAQIGDRVARLFRAEFSVLDDFCRQHAQFIDPTVSQFDRELQFYIAYLAYIEPVRSSGLSFCYPELTSGSKEIFARETFDLALAAKLAPSSQAVVTNDFHLAGSERVIVVSGPNQGGKTTFARTFGQLHHLGATGCPVPGSAARVFMCDQIFTHFEHEEDIADLTGKLEDDLLRIQRVLLKATSRSVIIMNEIFTSTTLSDARFLGEKVLAKVMDLDLLCVYVTFVDELASAGPTVVSMAAAIVPDNPAERTYKVVRKPADGLAYALAIADKNRVTYRQLKERLTS
jgi:DNA mismatch repair protein MutS